MIIDLYISLCVCVCVCVCVQARGGGEEEAHLPHHRLREDVPEDVAAPRSRPAAHRRAALRLQLGVLREKIHAQRRAAAARQDAHRSDTHTHNGVLLWEFHCNLKLR